MPGFLSNIEHSDYPLKTILIRVRPAVRHGLLNRDCLCHSPMSLPLTHKTTSYLLRSQSVNIVVNRSQHVSFKHWSNGFWDVDSLGSVHCFLLSNLSSGSNTPQYKIGIINITRKKKKKGISYRAVETVFEGEWAESDVVWQNKYRRYATREHYNKRTAEERGRIWFSLSIPQ